MRFLQSLAIAFSMYSKIPMPKVEWNQKNMKYTLCFFPLVGVVIGIFIWAIGNWLLEEKVSQLFFAVSMTLVPIIISGGIHMDGFLDTVDALSSYGEKEKKLEILKDPHAGAFAILGSSIYFLWSIGIWSEAYIRNLGKTTMLLIACSFVLSRALSGLSIVSFRLAKNSGLAAAFQDGAQRKKVGIIMIGYIIIMGAIMLWINIRLGLIAICCGALAFGYHRYISYEKFGGITGDLAGYFLQICELLIVSGMVLGVCL